VTHWSTDPQVRRGFSYETQTGAQRTVTLLKLHEPGSELRTYPTVLMRCALFRDITQRDISGQPIGPILIGYPETSVRNYHYMLRNIPEERTPRLLQGGSLKLSTKLLFPKADLTDSTGIWSAPVPIRPAYTAGKGMFKHCDRVPRCGRKIHWQFVQIAARSEAEFFNLSLRIYKLAVACYRVQGVAILVQTATMKRKNVTNIVHFLFRKADLPQNTDTCCSVPFLTRTAAVAVPT
jgi:hypothetical protein